MKNLIFFLVLTFFSSAVLMAQRNTSGDMLLHLEDRSKNGAKVDITLDEGIQENYYKHLIFNSKNPQVIGYRIRIFSGSGHDAKNNATMARATFLSRYPDIGAYLIYDAPDYKVYVGDCRTQSEVLKLFERIKKDFPYSFISPKQPIDPDKYKSPENNE